MVKCINQLHRPKEKVPAWARGDKGDCTTCQPCEKNKNCSCFTPVSLITLTMFKMREEND